MQNSKVRFLAKKLINFSARLLPFIVWKNIEVFAQRAQGKGWGATSLNKEIGMILELGHKLGIERLVALDVGANFGEWTNALVRADPTTTICCFEPASYSFEILNQKLKENSNVYLFNTALGENEDTAKIYFDAPGSGQASLVKRRLDHFGAEWTGEELIKVTTLDGWLEIHPECRPNILKIDVEGFELAVLKGSIHSLSTIPIIQFEFGGTSIDTRTYFQDYWYFLQELGFKIYRFGPRGLQYIDRYSETEESFSVTNFFALKPSIK